MKARHKDTGEIIKLAEQGVISSDGRRFCWHQVELLPEPIDEAQPSLQQEQQKEPDKSLEEAAADFVWDVMENDYYRPSELSKRLRPTSKLDDFYGALAEIFIAGAKWQEGQLLKGSPLPEDTVIFQKGVEEGRRLEREDIMKDAVEKTVGQLERQWGGNIHFMHGFEVDEMDFPFLNSQECGYGDKVRIIVCKKKD